MLKHYQDGLFYRTLFKKNKHASYIEAYCCNLNNVK